MKIGNVLGSIWVLMWEAKRGLVGFGERIKKESLLSFTAKWSETIQNGALTFRLGWNAKVH